MKILVGTNTLTEVNSICSSNMKQFWFRLAKHFPDVEFITFDPHRFSIDNMRNGAAHAAMGYECDYLMFIDDDVLVDPYKTLKCLLSDCETHGADIAMAFTFIRGYPFEPMFFKHIPERQALVPFRDWAKHVDKNGLVWCAAVGFSCVLIKVNLLRRLRFKPFFVTGVLGTEDVYFCMNAREELGPENVKICCDTRIPTGHKLDPEFVSLENVELLRKYYEDAYPTIYKKEFTDDEKESFARNAIAWRGKDYAESVEKTVKTGRAKIKSGKRQKQDSRVFKS